MRRQRRDGATTTSRQRRDGGGGGGKVIVEIVGGFGRVTGINAAVVLWLSAVPGESSGALSRVVPCGRAVTLLADIERGPLAVSAPRVRHSGTAVAAVVTAALVFIQTNPLGARCSGRVLPSQTHNRSRLRHQSPPSARCGMCRMMQPSDAPP